MRHPVIAGLACLLQLLAPAGGAVEPAYLSGWPSVERVLADNAGSDHEDTMARQMAALNQLSLAIDELAGPRRWHEGLTPDEQRLRGLYYAAAEKIRDEAHATLSNELGPGFHGPFSKPPLRKWYAQQWAYETDPSGRRATLLRYLPADLVARFDATVGSPPEIPAGPGDWSWLVWAGVGLASVVMLRWLARGWQQRRHRHAAIEPALASTAGGSDDYQAAADEVLDSLEPYMVAAQVEGAPIPIGHLLQPYAFSYLMQYCITALETLNGKEPSREERNRVWERMLQSPRLGTIFSGKGIDMARRDVMGDDAKAAAFAGQLMAGLVLDVYAGRGAVDGDLFVMIAQRAGGAIGSLRLRRPPRPTRLHPSHARDDDLQRVILRVFTRKLIDPRSDGD